MPEGHTILRLAREHQKLFKGTVLHVDSPQGKFAEGAELLDGGRLIGVQAFGKHSLHRFRPFEDGPPRFDLWLHVHLGLYGKWVTGTVPLPEVVGQVRLRIWNDEHFAQLRGATVSEVLTAEAVKALQARLGEDPLKSKDAGATSYAKVSRSTKAIGLLLMDQAVMAGVGNVYRAEILFVHRIDPHRPGNQVSHEQWQSLWADLITLMRAGVRAGRIVTTAPADREKVRGPVRRDDAHYVYRRHGMPCRICGTEILMEEFGGRRLYRCPTCQAA
ncbi:MAG: zinc finger domain-containing protein [Nakamurella sp.]